MRNKLMTGVWRYILAVPPFLWERQIEKARQRVDRSTRFMSRAHRSIHHFVVREMPRAGGPIAPEMVARQTAVPLERTEEILQDLERRLTFIFRNEKGEVTWAYPVTVEKTPHSITFGSGEQIYGA